jgi:hypothetical protein
MKKFSSLVALCLGAVGVAGSAGCMFPLNTQTGPNLGVPIPFPVSPYFQNKMEDEFWIQERYARVPILGPITSGGVPTALDPPTPDEVMRAIDNARTVKAGVPLLYVKNRDNVRMVIEPIADYVDEPRVYPMLGPAQLHHAHYKCTVYFSETVRVGWPLPYTVVDEDSREVVYIDHNHLHMVGTCDPNMAAVTPTE